MGELLPIVLGAIAGAITMHVQLPKLRLLWFVLGCSGAGALASWINGELGNSLWALFLSFDALLAWLGAIGYAAATRAYGARRLAGSHWFQDR